MNRCRTARGHDDQFGQNIHPDAAAIVPTPSGRLEERDTHVAGWRGCAESPVICEWKESDHKIQIYAGGKCAMVMHLFPITFAMGTQKQILQGCHMFFLVRKGGGRGLLPLISSLDPPLAGSATS